MIEKVLFVFSQVLSPFTARAQRRIESHMAQQVERIGVWLIRRFH